MIWRYYKPKRLPRQTSDRGRWVVAFFVLVIVLTLLTSGCKSAPYKAATSAELAGFCHAADGLTTAIAIEAGAVEANPLMAPIIGAIGPWGFAALKIALGWWVYKQFDKLEHDDTSRAIIGLHNLVICGAAIHNATVIRSMP